MLTRDIEPSRTFMAAYAISSDMMRQRDSGACNVPLLCVSKRPREKDAGVALWVLRNAVKTFPFADAVRRYDPILGVQIVDLDYPPGRASGTSRFCRETVANGVLAHRGYLGPARARG
jgi:hypothetical protein